MAEKKMTRREFVRDSAMAAVAIPAGLAAKKSASTAVEKVPAETRWTIATKALTGAVTATDKALRDALGQERFNEAERQMSAEGGKAAKNVADALGLTGDDAKSAAETVGLVSVVVNGPELKYQIVEATPERAVVRVTGCPMWNRQQESAIPRDLCSAGCAAYCNGFAKSLNSKLTVSGTKAMPRGDSYCEWVSELQK